MTDKKNFEIFKNEICELKKQKNAILVGHYYTNDEVQAVCDFVGDSFALARMCKNSDADIIVFAGVHFMAESAKLLCPNKKVLIPVKEAGCKMADMVDEHGVRKLKEKYPDATVVCYINTNAKTKSECDVCVTSSNAVKIVRGLKSKQVIFLPDKNLGKYVQEQVPEKEIIYWHGCCPVHDEVSTEEIKRLQQENPNAEILVHPECPKEIRDVAHYVGSTKGIVEYVAKSDLSDFVIVTEMGILYELNQVRPDARYIFPETGLRCNDMKLTTIEAIKDCLLNETNEVLLEEDIINRANICLDRMLEMG